MSTPAIFWTVASRYRGQEKLETVRTTELRKTALLFGEAIPEAEPIRHTYLYKAVAAAIGELLQGAEAVEIQRHPPLTTTTNHETEHDNG